MLIDWLKRRLSPTKRDTPKWTELAESLQEYWENFDTAFDLAAALRSIYEANTDGQKMILREMGSYYEDMMPDSNLPISVALRKLELSQKETDVPLRWTLRRLGLKAEWIPLYMLPNSVVYGEAFYTKDEIENQEYPDNCLLTSRGLLQIDISSEAVPEDTLELAIRRCQNILPLHIVFDRCRLLAELACKNMPKIGIGVVSAETITVRPYQIKELEVSSTATRIIGGQLVCEKVEVRPQ